MVAFCFAMALLTATLWSLLGGLFNQWSILWIFPLQVIGGYFAWCVLIIIVAFFVTLPVNIKKPVKKPSKFYTWLFNVVNGWIIDMAGVDLVVTGKEKLDPNTKYLFVYNHRSNFDSQIVPRVFQDYDILAIAKPSLFKVPIAGKCIHAAGYMPIDRDNDRKAVETILKATKYLKNGYSVGLCPEGTRNKDSLDLLPFKNGGFKVAQRAKAPIVLMSIVNTEKIHKNFPFKRTRVYLDVVDVLPAEKVVSMTTQEIGDHAMQVIQAKIDEHKVQSK